MPTEDRRSPAVAPPRRLGLLMCIVLLVFIAQFFALQYWFAPEESTTSGARDEKMANAQATQEPFKRAAVMYLPADRADKFLPQFRWFHLSWIEMQQYEPPLWRTDIVIFTDAPLAALTELGCSTAPRTTTNEPNKCIVVDNYMSARLKTLNYPFVDSINVATHSALELYDWVLRTDIDTFLTPAFASWKPSTMSVGYGQYAFEDYDTLNRLARIMDDLRYAPARIDNVGSTWYGPQAVVRACAALTVKTMVYLHEREFSAEEKSEAYGASGWPEWHHGVLSLYAGHIAINECTRETGVVKREDQLDFPTSSNESIFHHAHLHTWQNAERFSKFEFDRGAYDHENISALSADRVSDYALRLALESVPVAQRPDRSAPFLRAAVLFFPDDEPRFVHELRWFLRSWREMQRYEPLPWRTDVVIFTPSLHPVLAELNCTPGVRFRHDAPNRCYVHTAYTPLRDADFDYAFGDSINVAAMTVPGDYDYLLRTDIDTFLTPAFATWKPATLVVGKGEYLYTGTKTRIRLNRIRQELNLTTLNMKNVGSTWYGPAATVRDCANLTVQVMKHLHAHEFTALEKSEDYGNDGWPEWHHGVLSLYAGHIAINHCAKGVGVRKRGDMLDVRSDSPESPLQHAHIHVWQDYEPFSKLAFMDGLYANITADPATALDSIAHYAMFMALDAHKEPGIMPTPEPALAVTSVSAVAVFLPTTAASSLQAEFRTLHRSWRHVRSLQDASWRTDLVVFLPPGDVGFLAELGCKASNLRTAREDSSRCVVVPDAASARSEAFAYDMDGVHVLAAVPEGYDYILKTTPDAVLAPGLVDWAPATLATASANYVLDGQGTGPRLERVAAELSLVRAGVSNIGTTWYGPAPVVRACALRTMAVAKHLFAHEFSDEEKSPAYGARGWPQWHIGVLELYAAQIALNDCTQEHGGITKRADLLEAPSSATDAPNSHAVLHTWQDDAVFSKHAFASGQYSGVALATIVDDIERNTSAYALYMALDAHQGPGLLPTPVAPPTPDPPVDLTASFVRAAVLYLPPDMPRFVNELRWFRRSWIEMAMSEPPAWRTDIVIYTTDMTEELASLNCSTEPRMSRTEPNKCIVVPDFVSMKTERFNYGYADSLKVVAMDHNPLYDYLLRTDIDTFLTPAFATWKPAVVVVGQGGYVMDGTTTAARLEAISRKLNLTAPTLNNVGSTWYGPATVLRSCAQLTVTTMLYLHDHEFTDEEKSPEYGQQGWPNWHHGVLTMYAGHLAMNHCARDVGIAKREDMLDFPTTSLESPHEHAHLHTWQNGERFSKFAFMDGEYRRENLSALHPNESIADYAMYLALDAHAAPGLMPGGPLPTDPPRDHNATFVRAVVVHVATTGSRSLARELRTLHRSWQQVAALQPPRWRLDLVVHVPDDAAFLDALNCSTDHARTDVATEDVCVVVHAYSSLRNESFPVDVDVFGAVAGTTGPYDWLLQSAPDAILAPGLAGWKPPAMAVAAADYVLPGTSTGARLVRVARDLGLSTGNISNVGLTWYGPAAQLQGCAALAIHVAKHLYEEEFSADEKSPAYGAKGWPTWHLGVIANYAGEIALNHCARGALKRPGMLEVAASADDAPDFHAHLHTWHNDKLFNKHAFADGVYNRVDPAALDTASNTSAYALAMALEAKALARNFATVDPASITSTLTRAAVLYMPSDIQGRFVNQLRWFLRSWQTMQTFEPPHWRTDVIVFIDQPLAVFEELNCSTTPRASPAEPNSCIVVSTYRSVKTAEFDYGFADSVNVVAVDDPALDPYDLLLRTDMDTFLTPAFSTWRPRKLIVGQGMYLGSTTPYRLDIISQELGWTVGSLRNIGSTWYGPAATVRKCAKLTMEAMMYLHKHSFTDEERSDEYGIQGWPEWHYGVLTLYGGHLAINHCAGDVGVEKRPDMLDFPTASDESPFGHAHLHTWQDYERFSKFAFDDGLYADIRIESLKLLDHISDYAMYMALDSHKAPGLMPTPGPRDE
ncbi:hypothetical protein ACHHYP_20405 [Achlya hypogyna]|uniref:DUF7164 domain-containing protein n=1 Tax=Achlya hypogyna TaxID=1202772 RepID=A0A1V9ZJ53_ACHHY|nr:hypothetical protein ACHHYP_20405 [Achlya hypogyna]